MEKKQKNNHENFNENSDYIWIHKQEIKSLYSKIIEYENKISIYKEMMKKNLVTE